MYKLRFIIIFFTVCSFCACNFGANKANEEAQKLIDMERFSDALVYLSEAIEKYPNNSDLFYKRGFCYQRENDYEKALFNFTNCIKIDNKNANGYYGLASFYHDIREYDLARNNYNKAIDLAKNKERKSVYLSGLASLANSIGEYGEAIIYTEQAMKLNRIGDFYYFLGFYFYNNQMKNEAEEAWVAGIKFDKFREIRFKHLIYDRLAEYYFFNGNYNEGINYIEKALELSPGNENYLWKLNFFKFNKDYENSYTLPVESQNNRSVEQSANNENIQSSKTSVPVPSYSGTTRDPQFQREYEDAVREYDRNMMTLPPNLVLPSGETVQERVESGNIRGK
jgi:tetratricopeptide (TPR) repeat protein